jgi:phosphotransferase system HPr (HPr) family protein
MSHTVQKIVTVVNPYGLHMRPAHLLSQAASQFRSAIQIEKDGHIIDCRSIMSILTLGAQQGSQLCLRADGEDAQLALEALAKLFEGGFEAAEAALSAEHDGRAAVD